MPAAAPAKVAKAAKADRTARQNGTGGRGSGGVGGSTVDGGGVPDAAVDGRISGKDSGCSVGGGSPARGFGGQLFAGVVGLAGIFGFTFAVRRRERRPRS